jgi:colanic acid/amylovoran biosynthesis glycosyltransferase
VAASTAPTGHVSARNAHSNLAARGGDGVWPLPDRRWVLHSIWRPGNVELTEGWLDVQVASSGRFDSRLLAPEAPRGDEAPRNWLVARDRLDLRLAYCASQRLRGLTGAWLARPMLANPPAVLHAHYGHRASRQLPLSRALGAPLVASFYGDDATDERFTGSPRWRRAYARLFDFAGALLAEGPAMAARLEALGCPPDKLRIVRLPADAEALERVSPLRANGFVACLAGRFIAKKGFDVGVRAFARALREVSDARLLLVGGGELEGDLRRAVAEERITEKVSWAGRLPFERFMAEVGSAHLGMYPSRVGPHGESEGGAPVTLIESQWLGVPSLVSDHDDLPFAAAPGGSVVLPPDDVDAWAEALAELHEDRARLRSMGQAAAAYARERNSPAANVRDREAVYESVLR